MNNKRRDAIIDDLLKKRPIGLDTASKLTYEISEEYNYDRGRYMNVSVCSDPSYGYDDAVLFSLGFRTISDVRNYISQRFFDGKSGYQLGRKKSTLTRRANRLWSRLTDAVRRQERDGGKGIYGVTRPYSATIQGYVYSSNAEEAKTMADMFFPPIDRENHVSERYAVKFIEIGSVDRLHHYNTKIREDYESQIERYKRSIEQAEKSIGQITTHITMLTVLEGHQVAVETTV